MTDFAPTATERAWSAAEEEAMTRLGLRRVDDDHYEARLDDAGEIVGRITLPLERHATSGVKLGYPIVEVIHLPTARLLTDCMPSFAPDDGAIGARLIDLPLEPQLKARYIAIAAADPGEVPAAIAEVTELVDEQLLPWLRRRADIAAICAHLARHKPYERPYPKAERLRRLTTVCYVMGDLDGAQQALHTFLETCELAHGEPALDEVNTFFAGAIRSRLEARSAAPAAPAPGTASDPTAGGVPARETGDAIERAWVQAEQAAMGRLGFAGPDGGAYRIALDDAGAWTGIVALPKAVIPDGVQQQVGFAAITHRPTETLLLALHGLRPDSGPLPFTVGVEVRDFPDLAGAPAVDHRVVQDTHEVPAAVATTMALVEEQYLPWLRSWHADPQRLARYFQAGPPYRATAFQIRHVERRVVISHLVGDNGAARAAFEAYLDLFRTVAGTERPIITQAVQRLLNS